MTLDQFKADLLRRFPFREGMNYMAVDNGGGVYQYRARKTRAKHAHFWITSNDYQFIDTVEIPDGIDWHDTLISRTENTQP